MIRIILGIVALGVGCVGWIGQLISAVAPKQAERWGLQEAGDRCDPLFKRAEDLAAAWDALVLWTEIAAGILLLLNNPFAPAACLIAGGISLDAGGRECAKYRALKRSGIRVGGPSDTIKAHIAFGLLGGLGLALIVYGSLTV